MSFLDPRRDQAKNRAMVRHPARVVLACVLCSGCAAVLSLGDLERVACLDDCAAGDAGPADAPGIDADGGTPLDAAGDARFVDSGDAAADANGDAPADGPRDSGSDARDAAVDAPVFDGACPGTAPPSGVVINGLFCADSTEVTNAQYAAFLAATGGDAGAQPSVCAFNTSHTPGGTWPAPAALASNPVTNVDWCDAYMYCKWAGKRLCGRIGGGATVDTNSEYINAGVSQWYRACSANGTRVFPYGAVYNMTACNGLDLGVGGPVDAGSLPGCVGGSAGLFDMSGNVSEWEDACSTQTGTADNCLVRGGSYGDNAAASLQCDKRTANFTRGSMSADIGFRCCGP